MLQVKGDLLDSVFGHDRSDSLQDELSAAIRNRELLHTQLLQRKSRLQVPQLIARTSKSSFRNTDTVVIHSSNNKEHDLKYTFSHSKLLGFILLLKL